MTKRPSLPIASFAFTLAALVGCAPIDAVEATPADDGCEHAITGPFADVIAGIGDEDPPDVSEDHTAYQITTADLLDDEGNRGGFVSYASPAEGDYYLFWSDHVDIAVYDVNADEVPLEDTVHEVPECDELAMYHLVELGVGTYDIDLGASQLDEVTLVIVPAADDAHGADDDGSEG